MLHSFGASGDGAFPTAGLIEVNGTLYGTTFGSEQYVVRIHQRPKIRSKTINRAASPRNESREASIPQRGVADWSASRGDRGPSPEACAATQNVLPSRSSRGAMQVRVWDFSRCLFSISTATALLAACGWGSQPPTAMSQTPGIAPARTTAHHVETTSSSCHNLYSFTGSPDGSKPYASLLDVKGTLYGTTAGGGTNGKGTVFSIGTAGTEHVLYSFAGSPDGGGPEAGLIDVSGTLYGTTIGGGTSSDGTVFAVSKSGKERVLYSFGGDPDGAQPQANLLDVKGTLYGTTSSGGTNNAGTVFSISTTGEEHLLHNFSAATDGFSPEAGLIEVNGTLYGTAVQGGAYDKGTVFSIGTDGTFHVLHSFGAGNDGANPIASLIDVKGTLYSTTKRGGKRGTGTVFRVSTTGMEHVVYFFRHNIPHPVTPETGLTAVGKMLYGTSSLGSPYYGGTVFSMTRSGTVQVVCDFRRYGYYDAAPSAS